jgi:hypothetical protein
VLLADLVFACFANLLMKVATGWITRLAAIDRRHFLLDALAEGRTGGLALAFLIDLLARFALLRVACLRAIEVLHLSVHASPARRASYALTGGARLLTGLLMRQAGLRVRRLGAIARAAHSHAAHTRAHTLSRCGLGECRQTEERCHQCAADNHQTCFHGLLLIGWCDAILDTWINETAGICK